jgi:hypothetical protein
MRLERKARNRRRRRRYPVNRIKQSYSYEPSEIAKLFGIHRNTVRHWLKDGLVTIDGRRPILVHGAALKAFLSERQEARRQKCGPGEFFCFRCRAPRKPWGNVADIAPHTEKVAKLTALCCVCETTMHRTIRLTDTPKLVGLVDIQPMASERIRDRPDASANCDFEKDNRDVETQPAE